MISPSRVPLSVWVNSAAAGAAGRSPVGRPCGSGVLHERAGRSAARGGRLLVLLDGLLALDERPLELLLLRLLALHRGTRADSGGGLRSRTGHRLLGDGGGLPLEAVVRVGDLDPRPRLGAVDRPAALLD